MTTVPQLRDIHLPPEPAWWPPSWVAMLLLAITLVALAAALAWLWRRVSRWLERRRLASFFDQQMASAMSDVERVRRASACLRRAVSRSRADAVALTGEAWLAVLDGERSHAFTRGPGRLLAEGPFRGDVPPGEADAAVALARARFIRLGAGRDA